MDYDAVLLDNDGVITAITERDVLARAVRHAFHDMGIDRPDPDHVQELIFGVTRDRLTAVTDHYGIDPEAFWYRRDLRFSLVQQREVLAGRKPLYEDVAALADIALPMGIVSTNQHRTIEFILDHYGLRDRFETFYGREMEVASLDRKKPATHYLDRALEDLDVSNALFVGDSESDVRAARAAGIDSVFLERDHVAANGVSVEPTYKLSSLRGLPTVIGGRA